MGPIEECSSVFHVLVQLLLNQSKVGTDKLVGKEAAFEGDLPLFEGLGGGGPRLPVIISIRGEASINMLKFLFHEVLDASNELTKLLKIGVLGECPFLGPLDEGPLVLEEEALEGPGVHEVGGGLVTVEEGGPEEIETVLCECSIVFGGLGGVVGGEWLSGEEAEAV